MIRSGQRPVLCGGRDYSVGHVCWECVRAVNQFSLG